MRIRWYCRSIPRTCAKASTLIFLAAACEIGIHANCRALLSRPIDPPPEPPWRYRAARYATTAGTMSERSGVGAGAWPLPAGGCAEASAAARRLTR